MLGLLVSVVAVSSPALSPVEGPTTPVPSSDVLVHKIIERMGYMQDVAAWKWRQTLPIEDLSRERVVIEAAMADAQRVGLDPESTRRLFELQIAASKDIQRTLHQRWRRGEPQPEQQPDLESALRPAITRVGRDIIRLLAITLPDLPAAMPAYLANQAQDLGVSTGRITALYDAAKKVSYAQPGTGSVLDYVRARGVLRVGTTGDYQPFSYNNGDERRRGVDIEMARRLAESLGVDVLWVHTSWNTLGEDLLSGRYDIAMSGVSRTEFRERLGFFSTPYHEGGKTPLARCEQAKRFAELAAIDRSGVRVIVNPGGTNERFVRNHVNTATIIVHDDNTTIFDELVSGRADVMITDAIEVELQARLHTELCATMPGRALTRVVKAYWMPKDRRFLEYVNAFLDETRDSGVLEEIFSRYLPPRPVRAAPAHP